MTLTDEQLVTIVKFCRARGEMPIEDVIELVEIILEDRFKNN